MFENYLATPADLKAIEEALKYVLHPKMKFVFSDSLRITKTLTVSYDSKYIYLWSLDPTKLTKIHHHLKIPDVWQRGWWAGIISEEVKKYLPSNNKSPIINGGLLTPFITLQNAKNVLNNPYTSNESYFATIVHEYGHIYFGGYGKKGELSAFCTEYYASQLFWPKHTKNLNRFIEKTDKNTPAKIKERDQHTFALLNAKNLLANFPKSWPEKLLNY
ncbi:MAG: hypothetical protein AAB910_03900 [Patescibacteria group bacterium]